MHQGQLVFSQLMRHLPLTTFRRCVARYAGEHKVKSFSCLDQYLCMAFAQLTYRESLRDIEASLRAQAAKLYHLGIRGNVSRNTLANANATRDWRIYASFAERLIGIARGLYAEEPFGVDLAQPQSRPRVCGSGRTLVSAGRALQDQGVLSELVTQFVDVEFARHAAQFRCWGTRRPSSTPSGSLLYSSVVRQL
jgi:lambda repressor-like predicted transcriptional regulator